MKLDNELFRNGSGYVDITAYRALQNYQREVNKMEFNRGEIFEYEMRDREETKKALVVSADFRSGDRYLNVIVLTDEPKGEINVPIACQGMMYADCGMVSFATYDRLGSFIKRATNDEMNQIDEGIAKCLGLEKLVVEVPVEKIVEVEKVVEVPGNQADVIEKFAETTVELASARTEANVYKNLYEQLLAKMIG